MSELKTKFRRGPLVDEFHDGAPGSALSFVPDAGAARCNAPVRGNTGHLRVEETCPAHRTVAVVHEVPLIGHAFFGAVLRHGRDHHPVLQLEAAYLNGRNIGGRAFSTPLRSASQLS